MRIQRAHAIGGAVVVALLGTLFFFHRGSAVESVARSVVNDERRSVSSSSATVTAQVQRVRRIAGDVVYDGRPASNALVRLEADPFWGGDGPSERRADAKGHFDFGNVAIGVYTVSASAPERTTAIVTVNLRERIAADALRLVLTACDATVHGVVRDSGGGVIAQARIHPLNALGVTSGHDGKFELCLSAGGHTIVADAEGYGSAQFNINVSGSARTLHDVILVPAGFIVGRVIDATEQPAKAARVRFGAVTRTEASLPPSSFACDALGRFRIAVTPGVYWVSASDGQRATGTSLTTTVLGGQNTEELTLRLDSDRARLTGVLRNESTVLSGVHLRAISAVNGNRAHAVSESDGTFVFASLPLGRTVLTADPWQVVSPTRIEVQVGEQFIEVNVRRTAGLHGVVQRHGKPLGNAQVAARCSSRTSEAISSADGQYSMLGLESGLCDVLARTADAFVQETVTLKDGEDRELNLDVRNGASISGTVTATKSKHPVANVNVQFVNTVTADTCAAMTDERGHFRCGQMTGAGQYQPRVFSSAGERLDGPFALVDVPEVDSQISNVELSIASARTTIIGTVVTSAGQGVPDVIVRPRSALPNASESPVSAATSAISDVQGRFTLSVVGSRPLTLEAQSPDGATASMADVAPDAHEVVLTLQPVGTIEGTLEGFSQTPIVYAATSKNELRQGAVENNAFRIRLPASSYTVTAMLAAEGDSQRVEVKPGATTTIVLRAHGSAEISGRAIDHETKAPLSGLSCHTVSRSGDSIGVTNWSFEAAVHTDAQGRFFDEHTPAGDVAVLCYARSEFSRGAAFLSVASGGSAEVSLALVRRRIGVAGDVGLTFASGLDGVRIIEVRAGSSGARGGVQLGEKVLAIDDVPIGALDDTGVSTLILNHEAGRVLKLATSSTTRDLLVEPY